MVTILLFLSLGFDLQIKVDLSNTEVKSSVIPSHPLDTMANSSIATIVIHMSGEMGNHISHLAHAYPIAWWAERKYGIRTRMIILDQVVRGKVSPKSGSSKRIFTKCFPHLKSLYNSARANATEYRYRLDQQHSWDKANGTLLQRINDGIHTMRDVDATLEHLQVLAMSDAIPDIGKNATISLPLLQSIPMENNRLLDWFYRDLRWLLTFNDTACCKALPDADETVLVGLWYTFRSHVHLSLVSLN
jgi:hypothetical protein